MRIYNFDTVFQEGRYKGKTVQEVFDKDKSNIFKLIKKYGYSFDDEVLAAAHITKIIRNHEVRLEWEHHVADKNSKKYKKDTKTVEQILNELDDERMNIKDLNNNKEHISKKKKPETEYDEIKLDEIDGK